MEKDKNLEPETVEPETVEPETGTDIKTTPEYLAMKEMMDNQTTELEKLQKQVKELQVEKEKMALMYGRESNTQETLDNAWLGFSRYSHDKK